MEVPIQQAARTLGILPSILWRQIENGELKGRKKGRIWYVEHPEKEEQLAPIKSQLAKKDQREPMEQEPPNRELIETLRKQIQSQAKQIKVKDRQIQELHLLLQNLRNRRNPLWPFGH